MSELVTLEELALFMGTPNYLNQEPQATLMQEALDSAEDWTAKRIGPLTGASRVCKVHPSGFALVLPVTRLAEVTAVTDPTGATLDVTTLDVDLLAGIVYVPRVVKGQWTVVVTSTDFGKQVALAVKIIASHLWETQRRQDSTARSVFSTPDGGPAPAGRGFAIPHRAAELLAEFTIGPAA